MVQLSTIRFSTVNNFISGNFNCTGFAGTYFISSDIIDIAIPGRDDGECGGEMNSVFDAEVALLSRVLLYGEPLSFELTDNGLTLITSLNEMLFFIDRGDEFIL